MNTSKVVTACTHWIDGWCLRPFTLPIVRLDGSDHEAKWDGRSTSESHQGSIEWP